ncbi:hypothetical protein [Marinobacter zhanjiangensis]|uniref:Uncharacterized protein n=1 Tax=Marinobacter zhanjiangensis TaxID=578215 RepID=A0ABQ3B9Q8_9GAMM|nr:hypothetical protein [Marinobacter zhanjiangensis]GGY86301.1 hypothetical protein GCM10007071_37220 [Marinobacter zhanjiangensis]
MSEKSQTIVERIAERLKSLNSSKNKASQEAAEERFKRCIDYAVDQAFIQAQSGRKDASGVKEQLVEQDLIQQNFYRQYKEYIGALYARDKLISDELNQLKRVENAQGRRNAFWRFVSTIAVGFAILIIYAVADHFEVALPLAGFK